MKLNVPYYSQRRAVICGVAALRMVLDYYHSKATEKELLRGVKLHSFGTFSTDLGVIALISQSWQKLRQVWLKG